MRKKQVKKKRLDEENRSKHVQCLDDLNEAYTNYQQGRSQK